MYVSDSFLENLEINFKKTNSIAINKTFLLALSKIKTAFISK